ncbi:ABC transporter ATP-binding protein [Mucisphaera sp.]|uniref:ABC transporter ATP-binding protein n=1 Tax=Mucisphaera sp. TaxID=2913024 RepID=UPI003D1214E2
MTRPAIEASHLSKRYRLGAMQAFDQTLRDALSGSGQKQKRADFWALKDVSFEVQPGECLGVIGRNGAGKSTLLKLLAQITEPTSGQARLAGRVGSLLEVGTGFHPELTGRENIYLNGAILGMSRKEIARRFDEIVDFSGVERFLETPVKRYSSGMTVRLAFAVAAHLEPEILLVDEVLAVGDAAFQKRCLGKMSDVAASGRTILFISHNMAAIENLCDRAIVLREGQTVFDGAPHEAVGEYLRSMEQSGIGTIDDENREGSGEVRVTRISLRDLDGHTIDTARCGQDIELVIEYQRPDDRPLPGPVVVGIGARTGSDIPVFLHHSRLDDACFTDLSAHGSFVCRLPRLPLAAGSYQLAVSVSAEGSDQPYIDFLPRAYTLTVIPGAFYTTTELPPASHGSLLIDASWSVEPAFQASRSAA